MIYYSRYPICPLPPRPARHTTARTAFSTGISLHSTGLFAGTACRHAPHLAQTYLSVYVGRVPTVSVVPEPVTTMAQHMADTAQSPSEIVGREAYRPKFFLQNYVESLTSLAIIGRDSSAAGTKSGLSLAFPNPDTICSVSLGAVETAEIRTPNE